MFGQNIGLNTITEESRQIFDPYVDPLVEAAANAASQMSSTFESVVDAVTQLLPQKDKRSGETTSLTNSTLVSHYSVKNKRKKKPAKDKPSLNPEVSQITNQQISAKEYYLSLKMEEIKQLIINSNFPVSGLVDRNLFLEREFFEKCEEVLCQNDIITWQEERALKMQEELDNLKKKLKVSSEINLAQNEIIPTQEKQARKMQEELDDSRHKRKMSLKYIIEADKTIKNLKQENHESQQLAQVANEKARMAEEEAKKYLLENNVLDKNIKNLQQANDEWQQSAQVAKGIARTATEKMEEYFSETNVLHDKIDELNTVIETQAVKIYIKDTKIEDLETENLGMKNALAQARVQDEIKTAALLRRDEEISRLTRKNNLLEIKNTFLCFVNAYIQANIDYGAACTFFSPRRYRHGSTGRAEAQNYYTAFLGAVGSMQSKEDVLNYIKRLASQTNLSGNYYSGSFKTYLLAYYDYVSKLDLNEELDEINVPAHMKFYTDPETIKQRYTSIFVNAHEDGATFEMRTVRKQEI